MKLATWLGVGEAGGPYATGGRHVLAQAVPFFFRRPNPGGARCSPPPAITGANYSWTISKVRAPVLRV